MKDIREFCIQVARDSNHPYFRLGAVLVKDGNIVSFGSNLPSKMPSCYGLCAETRILRNPPRKAFRGATLYVARVVKCHDNPVMARPCKRCQQWIKTRHVKEVHYTDQDGRWIRETF